MKLHQALRGFLIFFGLILAVAPTRAQVAYQLTSTPTFVIDTGRSEVLGEFRITATTTGPSIASTIEVFFQSVACDNDTTSGMSLTATGVFSGVASISSVNNAPVGCMVAFTVPGGLSPAAGKDYIELDGVRGRIDLSGIGDGGNVTAIVSASPSTSTLFTAPNAGVVGTVEPGLSVSASALNVAQGTSGNPTVTIIEGFNAAFVQNVTTITYGSPPPSNPRPLDGANANTQVRIVVSGLPSGVTIKWPATVNSSLGAYVPATSGSQLQLLAGATSTTATYEYACGNQGGSCDIIDESFAISPTVTAGNAAGLGTATVQATLFPNAGDTGTTSTTPPLPMQGKPRFVQKNLPSPPAPFLTVTAPGAVPVVSVGPSTLLFVEVVGSGLPASQNITLFNRGAAPLIINAIIASPPNFAETNNCPATLDAGFSCQISVAFNATAAGTVTGTVTIADNNQGLPGSQQSVSLKGVGITGVSVSPTTLNFGNQMVGTTSAPQTAKFSNSSTSTITFTAITANPPFAESNNCASTLTPGLSCTVNVTFEPTSVGLVNNSNLLIDFTVAGDTGTAALEVGLNGAGVPSTAAVTLSPAAVNFGNQVVRVASSPLTLTLSNSGASTLAITSIVASPSVFAQKNNCVASLAAGTSCQITLVFTPSALGAAAGEITITDNAVSSPQVVALTGTGVANHAVVGDDFDGDHKTDIAVWRPSTGEWWIIPSTSGGAVIDERWGTNGDIPVRGDFDGDGKTDIGIWRPSTGEWWIIPSSNPGALIYAQWGTNGDIPVPGDYDGDGKTDMAVWRPSTGEWWIIPSSNPGALIYAQWGTNGDIPVPGDYDGDGKTDMAVWRPSTGEWRIIPSSNPSTTIVVPWGTEGDIPVPGDYDGDGKTDMAVWRPSTGEWWIIPSSNPGALIYRQWGTNGDIPVPGDYDGDGKTDMAIWRPSTGIWWIIPSGNPGSPVAQPWGAPTDIPLNKPVGQ